MDCREARNLLSDYQDGAVDAATAAGLAAHLRGCGECAGADASLLAVREVLRDLPPDPAPPELLARVLAAVEAEGRNARPDAISGGAGATRSILSRFRVPLEAAAAVLLFASVYWYQQAPTPAVRPPAGISSGVSSEAGKASPSPPPVAKKDTAKRPTPGIRPPRGNPEAIWEAGPSLPMPRTWTAESLPSVPVSLASTDSERIVPIAPRRPLSTHPYGREIVVDVKPESREGAEERIAGTASRLGGTIERNGRKGESSRKGGAGTVRVVLPEAAAAGFLDELRRIGTVPPDGMPEANDIPRGPRPGTVAYTVTIRVR